MSCSTTGCDADVFIKKRQLCRVHYLQAWRRAEFGHTRRGGTWHRVEQENLQSTAGTCAICGPIELVRSGRRLVCPTGSREQTRKWRHGVSPERMTAMLDAIGWACEICKADFREEVYCIDHDHGCCSGAQSCGECVRGILCRSCNAGIGMFQDDPELAHFAAFYLARALERAEGDSDLLPSSEKSSIFLSSR
jgi:hypothetical protein